jgi:hypothetical protein
VNEPQSSFAKRLVQHFHERGGLGVLTESVKRICASAARVQIFVSYSANDRPTAEKLATIVRNLGHDVWLDTQSGMGTEISRVTVEAIQRSDVFLALLASGTALSPNVAYEIGMWMGARGAAQLIPITVGRQVLPDLLGRYRRIEIADWNELESEPFQAKLKKEILSSLWRPR